MKVRTSHDTIEDFSRNKIVKALVNEADAPSAVAEKIASEVEAYLSRIEIFPTTTMIREMVNAKLVEYGFDDIVAYHQRLGLPRYDVQRILTRGDRMDSSTQFDPESIHKHMGDMIAKDYALSTVIPPEIADAHRRGMLHIGLLEYFVTRPFCFTHDLRYFLLNGLRVDGSGRDTAVAGPAKHAEVAVFHAAKVLASSQVFWSGGQSYNFFNVFMAPFFRGKSETETIQLCQMFIYEMSQQYAARGGQMVFSSISLIPGIPEVLEEVKAVKPGGILGPEPYADYADESIKVFRGMMKVLRGGDFAGKPFPFPQVEVKLDSGIARSAEDEYLMACDLSAAFGSPVFLNLSGDDVSPWQCSVESGLIVDGSRHAPTSLRGGILQEVTVNLPRAAYDSRGREKRMHGILEERLGLAREVHLLKKNLIESRMREGSLSFPAQSCDGASYLETADQALLFGVVGLNETVKVMTGSELHESSDARALGTSILETVANAAESFSGETGLTFDVCQSPSVEAGNRLALIDRRQFRKRFEADGDAADRSLHYTAGAQVRASADVPLGERLGIEQPFHRLLGGGAVFDVSLAGSPRPEVLWRRIQRIVKAGVPLFGFTQDLSVCLSCGRASRGLVRVCPSCGSTQVDWLSRIGGRISRVGIREEIGGWDPGSRKRLLSRKHYRV
jgi:ribonucleoside-triphosphate reductase